VPSSSCIALAASSAFSISKKAQPFFCFNVIDATVPNFERRLSSSASVAEKSRLPMNTFLFSIATPVFYGLQQ
jgi:hypothetical protein